MHLIPLPPRERFEWLSEEQVRELRALITPGPLNVASDETFTAWCATPAWDLRTLEEFAEDGGRPAPPPDTEPTLRP